MSHSWICGREEGREEASMAQTPTPSPTLDDSFKISSNS